PGDGGTHGLHFRGGTLGDICEARGGIQTGPFGSQLHASDYCDDGVPVIMPKDMVGGRFSEATVARVDPGVAGQLSQHRVQPGDILLARRGEIGRCALVGEAQAGWLCGTGCIRVRLSDGAVPSFVFRLISSSDKAQWLEQHAVGQTMPNLNASIVARLPLALPAPQQRQRIADILDTTDNVLRATEALIEAKLRHRRALAERLLTGSSRSGEGPGLVGASRREWSVARLSEVADVRTGLAKGRASLKDPVWLPYLAVSNVQDGFIDLGSVKQIE